MMLGSMQVSLEDVFAFKQEKPLYALSNNTDLDDLGVKTLVPIYQDVV